MKAITLQEWHSWPEAGLLVAYPTSSGGVGYRWAKVDEKLGSAERFISSIRRSPEDKRCVLAWRRDPQKGGDVPHAIPVSAYL